MKILDVETLLPWGEPKQVFTRNGERTVRKAAPDERFWAAWRADKQKLVDAGVSLWKDKDTGNWEATLWPLRSTAAVAAQEPQGAPQPAIVRPDIAAKLLPYQVPAVGRIVAALDTFGTALDASDTGTGKTFIALAAAKQLGFKPVILCPKSVRPSWSRAAQNHFGMDIFVTNYEQMKLGKTPYCSMDRKVRIRKDGKPVTDKKGKPLFDTSFKWNLAADEILVVDECHRCSGNGTANSELVVAAKDAKVKTLLLSATAADSPLAMRAIGYGLGLFPSVKGFYSWAFRNGVQKGRYGMTFTGGQSALKKIHSDIFGRGKGNRLRIADIPGFPETSIFPEAIDFDNSSQIQDAYDDMKRELSRLDEVEAKDRQGIILTEMLRARQRTELLKVPTLAQMANDAIAEGMSVAIFVNFQDSLDALAAALETDCTISGAQQGPKGEAEREANIQRFQRGNFPRLSLINPSFSAKAVKQSLGRVHRSFDKNETPQWSDNHSRVIICNINAGGVGVSLHHLGGKPSIQRIVFAAGVDVEESACEAIEKKTSNISMLNDGDLLGGIKLFNCDKELALSAA